MELGYLGDCLSLACLPVAQGRYAPDSLSETMSLNGIYGTLFSALWNEL